MQWFYQKESVPEERPRSKRGDKYSAALSYGYDRLSFPCWFPVQSSIDLCWIIENYADIIPRLIVVLRDRLPWFDRGFGGEEAVESRDHDQCQESRYGQTADDRPAHRAIKCSSL